MRHIFILPIIVSFLFLPFLSFNQCSETFGIPLIDYSNEATRIGQSFTMSSCADNHFASIRLTSAGNNADVTFRIYEGSGFGGNLIHTQTGISISIGINTITLDANVPFVMGNTYTFSLEIGGGIFQLSQTTAVLGSNLYTGGTYFDADGNSVNNVDLNFAVTAQNIFPVELIDWQAKPQDAGILLSWRTLTETDNAGFEIQHSSNGMDWKHLGFVDGQGHSTALQNYQFMDRAPSAQNYYRLIQYDYDGQTEIFPIIEMTYESGSEWQVYPNPLPQGHLLSIRNLRSQAATQLQVLDWTGRIVAEQAIPTASADVALPKHLPKGSYIIRIRVNDRWESERIILQ
ncbi:MAG: T9SS type A sorting domain-containing protein [Saprospiraceae bacterium]|nr:T9SS type A sorting domain-containing protein [Saprospiraceae bacterium]